MNDLWTDLDAESRKPGPTMTITKAQYAALRALAAAPGNVHVHDYGATRIPCSRPECAAAPGEGLDVAKITRDMAEAMPWYDESNPDFSEAEAVLRAALAAAPGEGLRHRNVLDPLNAPTHRTGKPCVELGCDEPAGTGWSPAWCVYHNALRIDRISGSLARLTEADRPDGGVE